MDSSCQLIGQRVQTALQRNALYAELDSSALMILQSVESAETKYHRKVMKNILVAVDTVTRFCKKILL